MDFAFNFSTEMTTGNVSPEMMNLMSNGMGSLLGTLFGGMIFLAVIIGILVSVFMIISRWKVLVKAWLPGWGILIPFYNFYLMFKLWGRSWWNFLRILFPPVFMILIIINHFKIAVRFGKMAIYGLGIWFLPIVFIPILAFDHSLYIPKTTPPTV